MAGRNFRSLWSDAVTQQARKIFTSYTKLFMYPFYLVFTIHTELSWYFDRYVLTKSDHRAL